MGQRCTHSEREYWKAGVIMWDMIKERAGLEENLFTWDGWDQQDTACFSFYNCKLKHQIADIPAGTEATAIFVDFAHSYMQIEFDDSGDNYRVFALGMSVLGELK